MATYKPIRKTESGTEEIKIPYAVLADPPTIPAAITSINGLSGGTLTSPLTLTGGDATTASKIILTANGQITDQSTSTLFGRSSGNLIVGHQSIPLRLRGKAANPVYSNDNKTFKELAFKSDIPDISGLMPKSGGAFTGNISVPKELVFTNTTNPFIRMTTQGVDFYFQSTSGQFGLGPTWNKATHWDSNGNVTFPTVPKVGSTSLVLTSAFSLSGTTLTITI